MEAEDLQLERRRRFRGARRAVVKLGTSVVSGAGGEVSNERVAPVVRALAPPRRRATGPERLLKQAPPVNPPRR
ncbi:MAG: hypothetical protein ACJ74T_14160 [Pyrinomonadaceae bacterium]